MRSILANRTARVTLALTTALVLLSTACATPVAAPPSGSGQPATTPSPSGAATVPPGSASPTTATPSTLPPPSSDAWLAVGRKGDAGLQVILASGGDPMFDALPTGVPLDAQWGRLITTEPNGASTIVRNVAVQPGFDGIATKIAGAWRLPTIGSDPVPVGVSANGQTIVLVEADGSPGASPTRFAVLTRGVSDPARIVELRGRFDYDALSPDGKTLYVVEHLDTITGGRYQVRAVDVARGSLRDGIVVDKTKVDEPMAGYPLAQVRRPDGLALTLYRGREHPFIHALNTAEGWAVCLDLPGNGDDVASGDWGLAASPDGSLVYAANATLGLIAEVDPAQLQVRRSVTFRPLAGAGIVLAKFGHQQTGPTGRRVIVGPNGRVVYAAGTDGIVALDVATLAVVGRFESGQAVEALAATPDGGTLYALLHDGRIVKLDALTGKRLATVPGNDFDRLVAVVPW